LYQYTISSISSTQYSTQYTVSCISILSVVSVVLSIVLSILSVVSVVLSILSVVSVVLSILSVVSVVLSIVINLQFLMVMTFLLPSVYYWKRFKWAPIKNLKIEFRPPKPPARDQTGTATLKFRKGIPK